MDDLGYWRVVFSNWRDWAVASDVQWSSLGEGWPSQVGEGAAAPVQVVRSHL